MTALFKSTHDALRFAYRFNGDNTVCVRLGTVPQGNGRGLGGLDGAAQAGMIKAEVRQLGGVAEAVVMAMFCLPGSDAWSQAVAKIARRIIDTKALRFKARELAVYLMVYFSGRKQTHGELATRFQRHRNTVSRSYREVCRYLGNKYNKGLCDDVVLRVDQVMRLKGIVGDEVG